MSAVPELKDELNRKSLETISHLITSIHNGLITPHQFSAGIDALWMAVSGLVDERIIDLITAGGNEAPIKTAIEKRIFIKERQTMVIDRVVGDDKIYIKSYFDDGMKNTKCHDCKSSVGARDAIISMAARLLANGYTEL